MKKLIAIVCLSLATTPFAFAATAQQGKMASCNTEAKGKKGDERKMFMKECLSADGAAASADKATPQQTKMKTCNADAAGMKGAERKTFMKDCLKKG